MCAVYTHVHLYPGTYYAPSATEQHAAPPATSQPNSTLRNTSQQLPMDPSSLLHVDILLTRPVRRAGRHECTSENSISYAWSGQISTPSLSAEAKCRNIPKALHAEKRSAKHDSLPCPSGKQHIFTAHLCLPAPFCLSGVMSGYSEFHAGRQVARLSNPMRFCLL